jgi:hypothetical protein
VRCGLIDDASNGQWKRGHIISVSAMVFGAKETTHSKINADLGLPDDPSTKALFEFLGKALKQCHAPASRSSRLLPFSRYSVGTTRLFTPLLPQTTPARRAVGFFRRVCKVCQKRRYTLERREPLGAFDLAKPRPTSTPAAFRKARDFDADST